MTDKNTVFSQSSIEKNKRIISDEFDLSEGFNNFFENAVRSLNIKPDKYFLSDKENLSDPVDIENHPSVQAAQQNISVNQDFHFSNTKVRDILRKLQL